MVTDEVNMNRIEVTASLVTNNISSVVDIGCGNGVFVNYLKQKLPHVRVVGLDRSKTALSFVKTEKVEGEIANLPFINNSFDCVCCLEVIEHLPVGMYEKGLEELARIADKSIIISVPYNEKLEESYTMCPQCRSVFNWELHLRSFSEENMKNLLTQYGFRCILTQKLNKNYVLRGHHTFKKIFYKKESLKWNSPICPVCGYKEAKNEISLAAISNSREIVRPRRKLISYFTSLPKLFWPKEERYYWILAKYERI
jgi:ubiquinone/menaquinone biosynthesis C-methylase UbiE